MSAVNGFYRIYGNENLKEFLKEMTMSEELITATISDFNLEWKSNDYRYDIIEKFGDKKEDRYGSKFDGEEIDYTLPVGRSIPASKLKTVMFKPGHYKQFCTNSDGSTASFEFEFSDGSLCIVSNCGRSHCFPDHADFIYNIFHFRQEKWMPVEQP